MKRKADMAFWSSEKLKERIAAEKLITPYDEAAINHCAYELAMGNQATVTVGPATKGTDRKVTLKDRDPLVIPPGQFALLLTKETVTIPLDSIGFISIRAKKKFEGLVNVSGFHVDPGFSGRLKFSVYNAGGQDILITESDRVFMLWYAALDRETRDGYGVAAMEQNEISTQDLTRMQGEVSSPAQLRRDIVELQHSLTNLKWMVGVFVGIAGSLAVALLILLIKMFVPTEGKESITPSVKTSPAATSQPATVINTTIQNGPIWNAGGSSGNLPAQPGPTTAPTTRVATP
jgi:dCTP deaminase